MKNRTGFTGNVLLIISCAFTVCIVILSVWYFLFQEQKTLNQHEIPSKTPFWSNTETTIIEESVIPLSDEVVMDAQQTDDESVTSTQQTGDESGEQSSSSTSEHNEISEITRSEDEIFMELFSEEWDQLEKTLKNAIVESAVLREILIDIDEKEDEASADYAVRVAQSGILIEEYERGVDRIATSFQEERREILERAFEIETLLYDSEILDLFGHWPREGGLELHKYLTTR